MSKQPNILIIMCDQLNASVLGCYGGVVPTPNLNRLVKKGVIFTSAICPATLCSPSRASLITGLYPHEHGIVYNVNRHEYPETTTPSTEEGIHTHDITTEKLLNSAGYETHHYGKWHLLDEDLSYYQDMFCEHLDDYTSGMSSIFQKVRKGQRGKWMKWYSWSLPIEVSPILQKAVNSVGDRWKDDPYAEFIVKMGRLDMPVEKTFDVQVAARTIATLRTLDKKPFIITCSFNYPHNPNVLPSPYYEAFAPEKIKLPSNFRQSEQRFKENWSWKIVADLGEIVVREFLRIYYGSIQLIDDQIGGILDALEATGRADETIVIFTADHGDMAGGHGMIWKTTSAFYEELVRIPLIIRYPNKIKPDESNIDIGLTDLMPTLLDLAGQPIPSFVQGHSLAPYLLGKQGPAEFPSYTFCERLTFNSAHTRTIDSTTLGSFMVRGNGWKYIRYPEGDEYLYDLINDPGEIKNLSNNPQFQNKKKELYHELNDWLVATNYSGKK